MIPATEKVTGVEAGTAQPLLSVMVRFPLVDVALDTPHDAPVKPVNKVTVGDEGSPTKAEGQMAVIVFPGIAVIALDSVKPKIQVEVAPVCKDPATNEAALGAVTVAMTMEAELAV